MTRRQEPIASLEELDAMQEEIDELWRRLAKARVWYGNWLADHIFEPVPQERNAEMCKERAEMRTMIDQKVALLRVAKERRRRHMARKRSKDMEHLLANVEDRIDELRDVIETAHERERALRHKRKATEDEMTFWREVRRQEKKRRKLA